MKYRWGGVPARSEAAGIGKTMRQKGRTPAMVMAAISRKLATPAAPSQTTLWDSARLVSDWALSEGDTVATAPNTSAQGALDGTTVKTGSGKYYFEVECVTVSNQSDWLAGFCDAGFGLRVDLTSGFTSGNKKVWRASGSIWHDGVQQGPAVATLTDGDILQVAIDLDRLGAYWLGKNNSWAFGGDPTVELTEINYVNASNDIRPFCSTDNSSGAPVFKLKTTAATCTYTAPSGFSYWDA